MKVKLSEVNGKIVKDNTTYKLEDNEYLENLVLSTTTLHPGQKTNGHSHDKEEEVYIFTHGEAIMQIDNEFYHAKYGDTFLIKAGQFHRVINKSESNSCKFTCVFQKYDRNGDAAKYRENETSVKSRA